MIEFCALVVLLIVTVAGGANVATVLETQAVHTLEAFLALTLTMWLVPAARFANVCVLLTPVKDCTAPLFTCASTAFAFVVAQVTFIEFCAPFAEVIDIVAAPARVDIVLVVQALQVLDGFLALSLTIWLVFAASPVKV